MDLFIFLSSSKDMCTTYGRCMATHGNLLVHSTETKHYCISLKLNELLQLIRH